MDLTRRGFFGTLGKLGAIGITSKVAPSLFLEPIKQPVKLHFDLSKSEWWIFTDNTYDIGSSSPRWRKMYFS